MLVKWFKLKERGILENCRIMCEYKKVCKNFLLNCIILCISRMSSSLFQLSGTWSKNMVIEVSSHQQAFKRPPLVKTLLENSESSL